MKTFGQRLNELLEKNGVPICTPINEKTEFLARKTGFHKDTCRRWLLSQANPSLSSAHHIAICLKDKEGVLFKEEIKTPIEYNWLLLAAVAVLSFLLAGFIFANICH